MYSKALIFCQPIQPLLRNIVNMLQHCSVILIFVIMYVGKKIQVKMNQRSTGILLTWSQIKGSDESKLLDLSIYVHIYICLPQI